MTTVGTTAEARSYGPITRTDIVRYQGASLDLNPIHHDDEFAAKGGYKSVFGVGMLQAGLLGTYVTDWFGAENVRRFKVRFKEQVWPGDLLECTGKVVAVDEVDGEKRATVELACTRQGGGVAVAAEAIVVL
ncbi:MAG TPA: MaoC/PaaZ C-terminal domain-containing protein [Acidimicrobiales bacterium]|nr:MaoC/PaaZ C-terminal domain-containing protein [Acidimicrobiales bacterium]